MDPRIHNRKQSSHNQSNCSIHIIRLLHMGCIYTTVLWRSLKERLSERGNTLDHQTIFTIPCTARRYAIRASRFIKTPACKHVLYGYTEWARFRWGSHHNSMFVNNVPCTLANGSMESWDWWISLCLAQDSGPDASERSFFTRYAEYTRYRHFHILVHVRIYRTAHVRKSIPFVSMRIDAAQEYVPGDEQSLCMVQVAFQ